jgi:ligand-binding sensor domain-containing protein
VLVISEQLNRVWLATDNGVAIYNNGNWQVFDSVLASRDTTSLAIDNLANVWVGTNGNGVDVYQSGIWQNYHRTNSGLANDTVRNITVGLDGRVWLATQGGVSVFDGAKWANYNRFTSGIASNDVYDIAIDAAGRVWAATGEGASELVGGIWETYQTKGSDIHDDALRAVEVE